MDIKQSFTTSPDERQRRREQIVKSFTSAAYRHAFVRQQIEMGLPAQIRGMRRERGWSQSELGRQLKKPQSLVSRLEAVSYGRFSLQTLLEIAKAFDVGLQISFVPFSTIANRACDFSIADVEVLPYERDTGLLRESDIASTGVTKFTRKAATPAVENTSDSATFSFVTSWHQAIPTGQQIGAATYG